MEDSACCKLASTRLVHALLLTKSVTAGTILYLNQTASTKAQALQNEAAVLMTTHLPPNLPEQENAGALSRSIHNF